MTGLALKSLWARRIRALTTILAVVIGVAFVAGTYILTDTTFAAFDEIFEDSLSKTDVVITAKEEVRQETGEVPSFKAAVLPKVKRVEGVRLAIGQIFTPGAFFDAENEQIGTQFAPKFITSDLPEEPRNADLRRGTHAARCKRGRRSTRAPPKRPGSGSATRSSWPRSNASPPTASSA